MKTIVKPISKLSNIDYEYLYDENIVRAWRGKMLIAVLNFWTDDFDCDKSNEDLFDDEGNALDQEFLNELYDEMTYYKENYYN